MSQLTNNTITHDQPNLAGTDVMPKKPIKTGGWRFLVQGTTNKICIAIVVGYLLVGLMSLFPAFEKFATDKYNVNEDAVRPSLRYSDAQGNLHFSPAAWFGTDFSGHSVFWRTLYGARTALLITVFTSVITLTIGSFMGIVAGFFGGWIDDLITWFYAVLSTIPWLLLVISITYVLQQNAAVSESGPETTNRFLLAVKNVFPSDLVIIILALGLTDWVSLCRLLRGETIKLRDSDMVAAGRALGLSEARILYKHILPNVSHLIIITFTLGAVSYMQAEVVLSFLGVGINSKPSWGRMIDDAKVSLMRGDWWEVTAATTAIFIICMALTILGDSLRDALDPKLRGRD